MIATNRSNHGSHFGVGDVRAVPCHEKVDAVGSGYGNVKRVPRSLRGKRPRLDQVECEVARIVTDIQQRKGFERCKAVPGSLMISAGRLVDNDLRDESAETRKTGVPPIVGRSLMSGNNHIAARPGGVVAAMVVSRYTEDLMLRQMVFSTVFRGTAFGTRSQEA